MHLNAAKPLAPEKTKLQKQTHSHFQTLPSRLCGILTTMLRLVHENALQRRDAGAAGFQLFEQ
jgi:hypothetical protein